MCEIVSVSMITSFLKTKQTVLHALTRVAIPQQGLFGITADLVIDLGNRLAEEPLGHQRLDSPSAADNTA